MPERIDTERVAEITGLSRRMVTKLAATGTIPKAAQFGRRWTFDEHSVRLWVQQREREAARCPAISTTAERLGGSGSRLMGASIDAAYERLIGSSRGRAQQPNSTD